jgi:hypothetical protein
MVGRAILAILIMSELLILAASSFIGGAFYFLPHFTWHLYELPSFTFTSLFCHSLLYQFMICPLTG